MARSLRLRAMDIFSVGFKGPLVHRSFLSWAGHRPSGFHLMNGPARRVRGIVTVGFTYTMAPSLVLVTDRFPDRGGLVAGNAVADLLVARHLARQRGVEPGGPAVAGGLLAFARRQGF